MRIADSFFMKAKANNQKMKPLITKASSLKTCISSAPLSHAQFLQELQKATRDTAMKALIHKQNRTECLNL